MSVASPPLVAHLVTAAIPAVAPGIKQVIRDATKIIVSAIVVSGAQVSDRRSPWIAPVVVECIVFQTFLDFSCNTLLDSLHDVVSRNGQQLVVDDEVVVAILDPALNETVGCVVSEIDIIYTIGDIQIVAGSVDAGAAAVLQRATLPLQHIARGDDDGCHAIAQAGIVNYVAIRITNRDGACCIAVQDAATCAVLEVGRNCIPQPFSTAVTQVRQSKGLPWQAAYSLRLHVAGRVGGITWNTIVVRVRAGKIAGASAARTKIN